MEKYFTTIIAFSSLVLNRFLSLVTITPHIEKVLSTSVDVALMDNRTLARDSRHSPIFLDFVKFLISESICDLALFAVKQFKSISKVSSSFSVLSSEASEASQGLNLASQGSNLASQAINLASQASNLSIQGSNPNSQASNLASHASN